VKKNYQKNATSAMAPVLPEAVSIAMAELAGDVQEGLLAMAVGTGLQVMAAMMNADVEAVCGPKGPHDANRDAVRHGSGDGSVTLGGRRLPVARPRVRAADGMASCRCGLTSCSGCARPRSMPARSTGTTTAAARRSGS
jgi:hypothetical protein